MKTSSSSKFRIAAACMITVLACSAAATSEELHSHPPPEKLGTVRFETSCTAAVAHNFERSVALLHSFAYSAAEKAFREVIAADPSCAMAHWGVAMSYYHQLWSPPLPAELAAARLEVDQALSLKAHTQRERQLIGAVAAYYRDYEHLPHPVRAQAYEEAMRAAAGNNPHDLEVQVFYALSLIATAPPEDKTHANQKRAALILEPIYREHPDHPGVAHYLIHDYDSSELAARGLAAARAYSMIAPSAPHALHMPSHIFTRLGLWDDSIASNRAARAAAHEQGDVGEELHAMDYLVYAYLQLGRRSEAQAVAASLTSLGELQGEDFKVGYAATAMPVRLAIEQGNWDEAIGLHELPKSAPQVAAIVFWARASSYARSGRGQAADPDIARLAVCHQQLLDGGNHYWATQVAVLEKEAKAWRFADRGESEMALKELRAAADEEDAVEKLPLTPGPIVPAREQLGQLLLALERPREALSEFQAALLGSPGRLGALTGAAQAKNALGLNTP